MGDILCNNIEVIRFINNPVPSNSYLLLNKDSKGCVVIDPGSKEQGDIRNYIRYNGYNLEYIILTHEHFDHCWGVNSLRSEFPAKVVTTLLCKEWIMTPMNYFNRLYYNSDEMFSIEFVDLTVEDLGWRLRWNNVEIKFVSAKGHTDKGVCVYVGKTLFSGDTMIWNTKPFLKKKYGASVEDLKETIERIYRDFDPGTLVYPGHGDPFKLGDMARFYEEYFALKGVGKNLISINIKM